MKLTVIDGIVRVRLSRRNLRALLHKLDVPGSARTLTKVSDDGILLIVTADPDTTHYDELGHEPGVMHPETEEFLAQEED